MSRALIIDDKSRNTIAARECGMQAITFVTVAQLHQALRVLGFRTCGKTH